MDFFPVKILYHRTSLSLRIKFIVTYLTVSKLGAVSVRSSYPKVFFRIAVFQNTQACNCNTYSPPLQVLFPAYHECFQNSFFVQLVMLHATIPSLRPRENKDNAANIYLFKVSNRNIRKRCKICSKSLTSFWCFYC